MATVTLSDLGPFLVERIERVILHNSAMFDQMGASLLASVRQGIRAEQAPDGTPWAPLASSTVKKRGSAHPMLRVKGHYYQSFTYSHGPDHARVGTNMPQARALQHGAVIAREGGTRILHFRRAGKQVRFARANKAKYGMKAAYGPYNITIPARPHLYNNDGSVPEAWKDPLVRIFLANVKRSLEGR